MSEPRKKVSSNLSETEYSAIKALFDHSDWDFESCVITNEFEESVAVEISEDTVISEQSDRTEGGQADQRDERIEQVGDCVSCFCNPCITTHRQAWLGNGAPPHVRNAAIRKTKYKKFWTMISRRNAWAGGRYIAKKTQQLNQNNEH